MKLKYMKKSFILYSITLSIVISNTSFAKINLIYDGKNHSYTADPITLMVNDKVINTNMPPVIIDGRTLVPARAVFEELGAEILWIEESKEVFITLNNDIILLKVNNNTINVNGTSKVMDTTPKIINNSVMIPLRFAAETLNFDVNWDSQKRIASVNSIYNLDDTIIDDNSSNTSEDKIDTSSQSDKNVSQTSNNLNQTHSNSQTTTNTTQPNSLPQDNLQGNNGEVVSFRSQISNSLYSNSSVKLNSEKYNKVDIIAVDLPQFGNEIFKITANGKISSATYGLLENPSRLYIDIENSEQDMDSIISHTQSDLVNYISISQNKNTVRVVFDIKRKQNYDIYFSDDRTSLYINFKPITVEEVTFQNTKEADILNIYSNYLSMPIISYYGDSDEIIIDIPNSISDISNTISNLAGNFVSSIELKKYDDNTVRLILHLNGVIDYDINTNDKCVTIKIKSPSYRNIKYENNNSPRIILNKEANININSIIHTDKYLDGYYKLTLPGNYSSVYGDGIYKVNDIYLNTINIENTNGNTDFIFNQKNTYTYKITEDEKNIYIDILNPKQVYKKVVVIDPGHGGSKPGTVQNKLSEKDINLDVSNRLYQLLENDPDIKVYATRITDVYPDFPDRTDLANHLADMFVSIHCNSGVSKTSGIQMFYPNPENTNGSISKQLAETIGISASSYSTIPKIGADQTIGYSLWVLRKTTMPSCLIEMGFLTNSSDASKLSNPTIRQSMAQGIYEGIKKSFNTIIPIR